MGMGHALGPGGSTRAIFPTGTAIRHYFERAADEVERMAMRQLDVLPQRVVLFLRICIGRGNAMVAMAEALGLSRSFVAQRVHGCSRGSSG
jgi:hypothetical protein